MGRNICLTCLYTKTLMSGTCGFPLDVSDILLDHVNAFTTLLVPNSHLLVHLSTFPSYLAPPLFTDWTEGLAPPWHFISILWTLHSTQYLEPHPSPMWLLDLAFRWFLFLEGFFSGSSLNVFSPEPCPRFLAPFPTLYIFPVFSTQIHTTQTFASISQTLIYYKTSPLV